MQFDSFEADQVMASISTSSTGQRRLLVSIDGRRLTRRLGRMSAKDARALEDLVNDLESSRLLGRPHDPATVARITRIGSKMREQLASLGLIAATEMGLSVSEVVSRYMKAATFKPATRLFYGHTQRNLVGMFGSKPFASVTLQDARDLIASIGKTLAPATVARRTIAARTIWRWGIERGYGTVNPFKSIKAGAQDNPSRKHYVPAAVAYKLMDESGIFIERMIALSRFGGLRCPSEAWALRWNDIDHDAGTIRITSAKTAHHAGKGTRIIPIFERLAPYLPKLVGDGFVFPPEYRELSMWKKLKDLCKRCGVKPWPKLWHNMRASCASDLSREFAPNVVCAWMGHSLRIADKHYLQVTPIDMERAQKRTRDILQLKPTGRSNMETITENAGSITLRNLQVGGTGGIRRRLRADLKRTSKTAAGQAHAETRAHQLRLQLDLAHAYHRVITRANV